MPLWNSFWNRHLPQKHQHWSAGVKIIFTSRVCDSHEHQFPLRNVHPVCHCLQQLLGYHPSMCPHAQVRVHGNIHVTQHCNRDNIVSVRAHGRLHFIALLYNQRQTRSQVLEGNWMESSFLNDKAFQKTSRLHNNARMALRDHLHMKSSIIKSPKFPWSF